MRFWSYSTKEIIDTLVKKSKFICANVQTNSGNRGFNFFKISKIRLFVYR